MPAQPGSSDPKRAADTVVVAVDGSDASVRALVWALRHAADHDLSVDVLTLWPLHGPVFVREVAGHFSEARWRAREVQAAAVAKALSFVDDAPAHRLRIENATVLDALARAGSRAAMVVVGSDGSARSERRGQRLSERICQVVPAPVVVVGPDGPVPRGRRRHAVPAR